MGKVFVVSEKYKRSYYLVPKKIIRDLVHEYVNVTAFELKIIATVPFQRLKDVRQLTCQQVYPSALHTRFEHSLGVLELTRQAVKHLNRNGIVGNQFYDNSKGPVLDDTLQFNATIAALLHDVGHCPFSHLGEKEFDYDDVKTRLIEEIKESELIKHYENLSDKILHGKRGSVGAIHEMISCIIILKEYKELLSSLRVKACDDSDACCIKADFELIIRSILGIDYDEGDTESYETVKRKNAVIHLINSNIIDMDKLDYIMRDSVFTGISIPIIDTQRLFRNMYLDTNYQVVFTSKAVPVLQSIIEARDVLYMYVYNHHVAVFSDFMHAYILSRLTQNTRDMIQMLYPNQCNSIEKEFDLPIFKLGLVPRNYLFSVDAIIEAHRSDSDWVSLLNIIFYDSEAYSRTDLITLLLRGEIKSLVSQVGYTPTAWQCKTEESQNSELQNLAKRIQFVLNLIHRYKTRDYLKPWWKTVYEFKNFMNMYFVDEIERKKVGRWICKGGDHGLIAEKFRSQVAKHVIYIASHLYNVMPKSLIEPLQDGDFFIVERSNRFFEIDTIEQLSIAIKTDGTIGMAIDTNSIERGYYRNSLVNIIPQKDYSSIYDKESFYIFTKKYINDEEAPENKSEIEKHNRLIERIFIFVVTEFLRNTEREFVRLFQINNRSVVIENETNSKQKMFARFMSQYEKSI